MTSFILLSFFSTRGINAVDYHVFELLISLVVEDFCGYFDIY